MNKIFTFIKYNKRVLINLIFLIMVIIGIFIAIGYLK